jgi:hypothetical protein
LWRRAPSLPTSVFIWGGLLRWISSYDTAG